MLFWRVVSRMSRLLDAFGLSALRLTPSVHCILFFLLPSFCASFFLVRGGGWAVGFHLCVFSLAENVIVKGFVKYFPCKFTFKFKFLKPSNF